MANKIQTIGAFCEQGREIYFFKYFVQTTKMVKIKSDGKMPSLNFLNQSRQTLTSGVEDAEDLVENCKLVLGVGLVIGDDAFDEIVNFVH